MMRFTFASIVVCLFAIQRAHAAEPEHTIEIEITVSEGSVAAHFSRCDGAVEVKPVVDPTGVMLEMNVPTGKKKLKKIKNRDGDSLVVPGTPWKEKFAVTGNGVYIFDLSDWRNKTAARIKLVIDGEVRFEGSGDKD